MLQTIEPPASIATVQDAIHALMLRFPKAQKEIENWGGSYKRVLEKLPPNRLEAVFCAVVDTWENGWPPKPADFAKALGSLPTNDGGAGRRAAEAHQALLAKGQARDELARRLVRETRARYAETVRKAADKWGVGVEHVERAMFLGLGKPYGTPEPGSRAHKAATEAVFKGAPEPDFIEIDLSHDAWAKYKRGALAFAQEVNAIVEIIPPGQHTIAKRTRENPEEEARRRDIIAAAERQADFVPRDDADEG